MDLFSVLASFASAVIGGLLTGWATVWAPRRELRAEALNALDQLTAWVGSSALTEGEVSRVMDAHLTARSALINGGARPDMVERFNAAALSYTAWALAHPQWSTPGADFEVSDGAEADELQGGARLLAVAYAARAVIRFSLLHPFRGRFATSWFRLRLWRYPVPPASVPAGINDDNDLRAAFREMTRVKSAPASEIE